MLLTSGPQLISIIPNDGSLLLPNQTLHAAPTQLTFRFLLDAGAPLDPNSLSAIQLTRSSGDGVFGNGNDVHVVPGYLGIDPAQPNQVVMRFSSPLVDDLYRITIVGGSAGEAVPLLDTATTPHPFNGGQDAAQDFRLDLGPQVLSVVPQPVTRDNSGALTSNSNEIDVYFDKPLQTLPGDPTHLNPGQFELIDTKNTATSTDDVVYVADPQTSFPFTAPDGVMHVPGSVLYDATNNEARLVFKTGSLPISINSLASAGGSVFRLRIGNSETLVPPPNIHSGLTPVSSGVYGDAVSAGVLGQQTQIYSGNLQPLPIDPNLVFPGGINDPGHRNIPLDFGSENHSTFLGGAAVIDYSFPTIYGVDPTTGAPLINQITDAQKQTVRQIFQLYSYYSGVSFVEIQQDDVRQPAALTPGALYNNFIAVGDMRALQPNIPPLAAASLGGPGGVVINGNIDWGASLYGSTFMTTAMHGIGHALGLPYNDDGPPGTIMNGDTLSQAPIVGPLPAPLFPGIADITNLQYGYEPTSNQIDLYKFTVDSAGKLSAETVAQRLNSGVVTLSMPADITGISAGKLVVGGDTFVISDGVNSVTFEFTADASQINPLDGTLANGNLAVLYAPSMTQSQLGDAVFSAIGGAVAGGKLSFSLAQLANEAGRITFPSSAAIDASWAPELAVSTPGSLNSLLTLYEEFNDLNLPAGGAHINDGDTFTITDNAGHTVTFQFHNTGLTNPVPLGTNVAVSFTSSSTQQDLAAAILGAIGQQNLNVRATVGLNDVELAGPISVSVTGSSVSLSKSRTMIARNDDYTGKDSFIGLALTPGIYYVAVTSSGNDQFDPAVPYSGWGGQTFGVYQLQLTFQPEAIAPLTDAGMSLFAPAAGAPAIPDGYSFKLTDVNQLNGQLVTETLKFYNGSTAPATPPTGEVSIQLQPTDTQNTVAQKIIAALQQAIADGHFNTADYILSNLGGGRIEVGGAATTVISVDPTGKGALTGAPLVLWGDAQRDALVGNSDAGGQGAYNFWFNVGATVYVDKLASAAGADGTLAHPYKTIQAALQNPAVTGAAANGREVNVRVVGNANASLGIAVNQTGAAKVLAGQTFQVSAGSFEGVFEFTNNQSLTPGQVLGNGHFAVILPPSGTASSISLAIQTALRATPLVQAAGGDVTVADGSNDGNYYYVKLFQGRFNVAVQKQTAPFNAQLTGVPVPPLYSNAPYLVGVDQFGSLLPDNSPGNSMLQLPKNVVMMVDAGAVFKLRQANIEIGSTVVNVDKSQSALQILGVPGERVTFTSYNDDSIGTPQTHPGQSVSPGDWGGLVFNNDSDLETLGAFLNNVEEAKLSYGGGQVVVNGVPQSFAPIYLDTARPTIANNTIVNSASAAISGNPNAFENSRFGSNLTIAVSNSPAPADGETFTIGGTVFEFDNNGVVNQGHVAVAFAGLTPASIATAIEAAVNNSLLADSVDKAAAVGNIVTLPRNLTASNGGSPLTFATNTFSVDYQRFGPDVHGNVLSQSLGHTLTAVAGGALASGTTFVVNNQGFQLLSSGSAQPGYLGISFSAGMLAGDVAQAIAAAINAANIGVSAQWTAGQASVQLSGVFNIQAAAPLAWTQKLAQNSINGLFVRINTNAGQSLDTLDVPAEFAATDIPYVLQENLVIHDGLGYVASAGSVVQRVAGQLLISPGVVVKLASARIEAGMGSSIIAEGTAAQPIIFTSLNDGRYGGGGTFDTAGSGGSVAPQAGDWGGFYFWPTSSGSLDHALITFGGGNTAIEGGFAPFDAVEIHQAKVRIANSTLENNAATASLDRNGREDIDAATIYVLGAQPVLVNNVIQNNAGAAISVDANSLNSTITPDWGRSTGAIDRFGQFDDNYGALIRLNKLGGNGLNGMLVRGATLETSSVWDDTDIVHVLLDEIIVPNFASVGGLRLQSNATQSLVVKLSGATAGFTAGGKPLDISDRIGGEVQVLGTPQHPVVLTSLADDSVGAGLTPTNLPDNDTNGDGNEVANDPGATKPAAGDWRGVLLNQYSNDRNVAMINETERALTGGQGTNDSTASPQALGQLAPNLQSGDDNSRLGFQVNGYISPDYAGDVDAYTFKATAGTQVWLNVTGTASSLDAVLELVDAQGNVLARSDDSGAEQRDATANGDPLLAGPLLKGELSGNLAQPLEDGAFGTSGMNFWSTNPRDPGMRVVLPGSAGVHDYYVRVYSKNASATGLAQYAPGQGTSKGQYQLQVRLQEQVEIPGSAVQYADIRYAVNGIDVQGLPAHSPLISNTYSQTTSHNSLSSAQNLGNLLTSDTSSINVGGNLATSGSVDWYKFTLTYADVQAIGGVDGGGTWATVFDVGYADGLTRPDTVIDVYDANGNLIYTGRDSNVADQQPRPGAGQDSSELNHSSFGTLDPYIGSVQLPAGGPGPNNSITYYVAIHSNATLPQALDGTFNSNSSNYLVRLEPINSVKRIVEDHVGTEGGETAESVADLTPLWGATNPTAAANGLNSGPTATVAQLNSYATPFNLSDVVMFVNTGGRDGHLLTVNPYSGAFETDQGQFNGNDQGGFSDIAIRNDGQLFALALNNPANAPTDASSGNLIRIDTANPANDVFLQDDGVVTYKPDPSNLGKLVAANVGIQYDAMAFNPLTSDSVLQQTPPDFWAIGHRTGDKPDTASGAKDPSWPFGYDAFTNLLYHFVWNRNSGQYVLTGVSNNPPIPYTNPQNIGSGLSPAGDAGYPDSVTVTGLQDPGFERITGLAMIGANGTMYAVSNEGNLYTLNVNSGQFTFIAHEGNISFSALSGGPTHVENGAYANTLFASDSSGFLYAFDTAGTPQPIFAGGATSVWLGTSVQGIAFSTLDYNLWHVTNHRGANPVNTPADQGHGITSAPDNSRTNLTADPPRAGGQSFYFGLENPTSPDAPTDQPGAGNYFTNPAIANGWVNNSSNYTPNYNLPGGAYGSLSTNTFSLANYNAADKPTLYFNYFLNTEDAQSSPTKLQQMFDSARVLISQDGGLTWQLLATNNNYQPANWNQPEAERPYYQTVSGETGSFDSGLNGSQRVQPLFDSVTTNTGWRQARVDLGDFAGQGNLQLRFDFSTAGTTFNPSSLQINAVTGKPNPYGEFAPGDQYGTFSGGTSSGAQRRGQNNSFEGWYIDDITIGLAERGEMVTNPNPVKTGTAATNYNTLPTNPQPGAIQQVLSGPYQLEIRRGTEYGYNPDKLAPDLILYQAFDSNDRLSQSYSLVAPPGNGLTVGETFTVSDGVHSVTFEFVNNVNQAAPGNAPIVFQSYYTAQQVADAIVSAVNSNPTLVKVSAKDVNNQANSLQGVGAPSSNIVDLFNVTEVLQGGVNYNRVTVSLIDSSVTESSTNNSGTVTRSGGDISQPLVVNLAAFDIDNGLAASGNVTFPNGPTVTIPANQLSASFVYNGVVHAAPVVGGEQADGTHAVKIVATAANFLSVGAAVDVTNDPGVLPTFTVQASTSTVAEGSAPVQFTVITNTGPIDATRYPTGLTVNLQSLDPTAAGVPASVTIPIGQVQATFFVTPIDDGLVSHPGGARQATILATAAGFVSGNAALSVTDDADGTVPYGSVSWVSAGPSPILGGQAQTADGQDQTIGAIETVLTDPTHPNVLYAGTVNGGIWKTTNYNPSNPSAAPTWIPLTDYLPPIDLGGGVSRRPSLSIGAMQFDATDPTNSTIIAGIGRFSSFAFTGGFLGGLLKTTDGGQTWTEISPTILQNQNISGVAERGNVILAAANQFFSSGGLYRSTDGGSTFTLVSGTNGLPVGPITDLVADPTNNSRFFAGVLGSSGGIFMTSDNGATWQNVSPAGFAPQASVSDDNIRIAVSATSVFFGYVQNGQLANVYYSPSPAIAPFPTWQAMDVPQTNEAGSPYGIEPDEGSSEVPGSQGIIHFAIAADPTHPTVVYVAGDRQPGPGDGTLTSWPNSIGATDYTGRLFRGDASITATGGVPSPQWTEITNDATINNTAPHADARHLAFDVAGNLINTNDGGIYTLTHPATTRPTNRTGDWYSTIGNLAISEMHSAAYDANTQTIIGGNQDTGTPTQIAPASLWYTLYGGDGGAVAVDNTTLAALNESIRYFSSQELGGFVRVIFDANNNFVSYSFPSLIVNGTSPTKTIDKADSLPFVTPVVLNSVNPNNLVISAAGSVYESFDHGDHLTKLNAGGTSDGALGARMVYGGMFGGAPNAGVLWVGTGTQVLLRTSAAGTLSATNYAGGSVRALTVDPTNWKRAFIADSNGHIWQTTDAGATYVDITGAGAGSLTSMTAGPFSAAYVPAAAHGALYIGTQDGVYELDVPSSGAASVFNWQRYGNGMPDVPVYALQYVPSKQMLLAGTMGRGAFEINAFGEAGALTVTVNAALHQTTDDGSATLTLTRTGTFGPLVVSLTSSDPTLASVPASVTIPDGFSSITIPITVIDSVLAAYPATVTFTATPASFGTAYDVVNDYLDVLPGNPPEPNTPTDNDTPELSLTIPGATMVPRTPTETLTATITRNTPATSDLVVSLAAMDPTLVSMPSTVVIPAGQSSITFTITVIDHFLPDVERITSIVAAAAGFISDSATVTADSIDHVIQYDLRGDVTTPRPQGEVILFGNQISNALQNGILVEGVRSDASSGLLPFQGGLINTPTLNSSSLAPGVVITNNLIYGVGQNGISFQGNTDATGAPGAVPFGRIVNNTIYGGDARQGVGINVANYASPTILNNILVNLATGIKVDASSQGLTAPPGYGGSGQPTWQFQPPVVGENFYQNNATNASPASFLGSFARTVASATPSPFQHASTDPLTANFYLVNAALPIDSSINSLQDRSTMTSVTAPLGIPPSPIIAPSYDLYGQLRVDDPTVTNANLGVGSNVFIDRGAIEHADTAGPTAALVAPIDNDQNDLNTTRNIVFIRGQDLSEFTLQLGDGSGAGIYDASVSSDRVAVREDGRLLAPGIDYSFNYDNNNHVIHLVAASGIWLNGHQYDIYLDNGSQFDPGNPAASPVGITDRASNLLQANGPDGLTHFRLLLANDGNSAPVVQLVSSGAPVLAMNENDNPLLPSTGTFSWTTPFSSTTATNVAISVFDVDANGGSETVMLTATHGTLSLNSAALAELQALGVDVSLIGNGTNVITITAPLGDASATGSTPGINAALEGLMFTPDLNFDSHLGDQAQITVTVNDNGNSPGPALATTYAISINVLPVNDAPVDNVPAGPFITNEDYPVAFSGANAVTVSDSDILPADANNVALAPFEETITLDNPALGTLVLGSTTGVSFVNGTTNGQSTIDFQGTLQAVNDALASLTFVPALRRSGTVTLKFTTRDHGNIGSGPALGLTSAEADIVVNITPQNYAPTLNPAATLKFADIVEDQPLASNGGSSVLTMLQSDPLFPSTPITLNAPPFESPQYGIAVVGATQTSNGVWQYQKPGDTGWTTFPAVSNTTALLLSGADLVRFVPNKKFDDTRGGAPQLTFVAWDGTYDLAMGGPDANGAILDLTVTGTGGSTPFSDLLSPATAALHVTPLALAPTLASTTAVHFNSIPEDQPVGGNLGTTINVMLGSDPANQPSAVTLHAPGAQQGIAIVGITETSNGTWQYQIGGGAWVNLPAVSVTNALLLDGNDTIRFLPNPKFDDTRGTGAPTLTFLAWDETFDYVNGRIDPDGSLVNLATTGTGGSTPFSTGAATAPLSVVPQPEAPTLVASANLSFGPILEDVAPSNNFGTSVLAMLQSDPANQPNAITLHATASPQFGIAVTGLGQSGAGTWQYQLAGGGWINFPAVSGTAPLLLDGSDLVRFLPNANFNDFYGGAATLSFVAWDETFDYVNGGPDVHGTIVNLASTGVGGSTPFSTASATAKLSVKAVNDAPAVTAPAGPITLVPSSAFSLSTAALPTVSVADIDQAEGTGLIQVTISTSENGVAGGAIGLTQTTGLTIVSGANHTSSVTFKGTFADVNGALAALEYEQDMNFNGTATVTFVANDLGNAGLGPQGQAAPFPLNSQAVTMSLSGLPIHRAPLLGVGTPTLPSILENVPPANNAPAGTSINSMLAGVGANFLTVDTFAGGQKGIAVSNVTQTSSGRWQYSPNGASWIDFGAVSLNQALMLPGNYLVRFWPNPGFAGTASMTFYAWDQVTGAAGTTVDLSGPNALGGFSSFSTANATATVTVQLVNQPPTFTLATGMSVLENNTVIASGGSPGGSNSAPITLTNFATGISPGQPIESQSPFSQTVTFTVSTDRPDLFLVQPTLDPAAPGATTSSLHFTLAPDVFGTAHIIVTAKDNGGTANGGVDTSIVQTTTLTVVEINDPPTLNAIANMNLLENATLQTVALSGIAAGLNESQNLTVTAVSDNPSLIPNPTVVYTSPNTTGQLKFTPNAFASGVAHITVTVKDDGGTANGGVDSFSQTFTVNVQFINDVPSFTKGADVTVNEDDPLTTVSAWATNVSPGRGNGDFGQTLNFIVTPDNPGVFAVQPTIDPVSGDLKFKFAPNFSGSSNVTIKLHDNGGTANGGKDTSTAQTFKLTANFVNDPPSFTVGPNQTVNENAAAQTIGNWATQISPGVGNNELGQTLTFAVTADNSSLFAVQPAIDGQTGTLTYTPALNASGTTVVHVVLYDNGGTANGGVDHTAEQTFTITINFVNHAPSFTAGPNQTINEDAPAQTVANWATNINPGPGPVEAGEQLDFIVTTDNPSLFSVAPSIDSTGALTYTAAPNVSGTANVTVKLHDNGGTAFGGADTSAAQTFKITVRSVNDAPSFTAGPNQTVLEDAPPQTLQNWATNISAGPNEVGQALNFIVTNNNPSLFAVPPKVDPITGTLTYTLATHAFGTANVSVSLHDNGGTANGGVDTSAAQNFTISALFVNHAPSFLNLPGDVFVNMNSGPQTIAGWASQESAGTGDDQANQTLNFIVTNDNPALFLAQPTINAATGALSFTPAPGQYGVANVTVKLHDNGGTANGGVDTSPSQTFQIHINAAPTAQQDFFEISYAQSSSSTAAQGVLSNDGDANGDPLTAVVVSGPAHGTLLLHADGSFNYTPGPSFHGLDEFTYRDSDGHANSNTVTVRILSHDASNVRKLYEQVLHRDPDDSGLQYWVTKLQAGSSLAVVAQGIFESDERLNPIISNYYQQFLLRPADQQGLAYWRDQVWKVYGGPEQVIAGMITSPEFFNSAGGTNSAWVTALYERLLGREPEPQGLQYWTHALDTHAKTERDVVLGFVGSDEYYSNLIDGFFEEYLTRHPTSDELQSDLIQMRGGVSQRDIQLEIVVTDEYKNTPPPPPLGAVKRLTH